MEGTFKSQLSETPNNIETVFIKVEEDNFLNESVELETYSKQVELAKNTSHKCSYCGKQYIFEETLIMHLKIHTDLIHTPFKCMFCNDFEHPAKKQMITHINIHIKQRSDELRTTSFICKICNKQTYGMGKLLLHVRVHTRESPFKCDICNKGFKQKGALKIHMETHFEPTKNNLCKLCSGSFSTPSSLKRHVRRIHDTGKKNRTIKCIYCKMTFSSVKERKIHQEAEHSCFKCQICSKSYGTNTMLGRHLRRYHGMLTELKCIYCGKSYTNKENYFQHVMTDHFGIESHSFNDCARARRYPCKFCPTPRIFNSFKGLKQHFPKHLQQYLYCDSCKSGPYNYQELKRHTLLMHQEMSCEICTEHLKGHRKLVEHLRYVHSKKLFEYNFLVQKKLALLKQLKCNFCGETFTSIQLVKSHLESDHNIPHDQTRYYIPKVLQKRNYVCKRCNQGFSFKRDLSKHMLTHQLKAFKCPICEGKFLKKSGLKAHMRRNNCKSTLTPVAMSDPTNTTCCICNEPFCDLEKLSQHIILRHCGAKKNYQCPICKIRYLTEDSLEKHASRDHPGKNLSDEVCNPHKANRFYCGTCNKGFMRYNEYFRHSKRKHKGSNECRICKAKYSRRAQLRVHIIKKHPGETFYKCGTCNQGFLFHNNYWMHLKTAHVGNEVLTVAEGGIDNNLIQENYVFQDSETVIIKNEPEATEIEVKMYPINDLETEDHGTVTKDQTETLENSETHDS